MNSTIQSVSTGSEPLVLVSDEVSHKSKRVDKPQLNVSSQRKTMEKRNDGEKLSSKKPSKVQNPEEGISSSVTSKVSNGMQPFSSEGRSPIIREKVSEDGYHWRKYGQKFVRGNEFVRSYYRCTYPSCLVKKQLECSHGGKVADIVYFGQHDHPRPQHNSPVAVGLVLSVVEDKTEKTVPKPVEVKGFQKPNHVHSVNSSQASTITSSEDLKVALVEFVQTKDESCVDDPISKRQKISGETRVVEPFPEEKSAGETRVVVRTMSEVDIVNDGHRWRKYGQKMVKGNANPRSYYRCSFPGCPVKKHVERAPHDPKMVITSYEGNHVHDAPPSRTVIHNTGCSGIQSSSQNGDHLDSKSPQIVGNMGEKSVIKEEYGAPDKLLKSSGEVKLLAWKSEALLEGKDSVLVEDHNESSSKAV